MHFFTPRGRIKFHIGKIRFFSDTSPTMKIQNRIFTKICPVPRLHTAWVGWQPTGQQPLHENIQQLNEVLFSQIKNGMTCTRRPKLFSRQTKTCLTTLRSASSEGGHPVALLISFAILSWGTHYAPAFQNSKGRKLYLSTFHWLGFDVRMPQSL